MKSHPTKAPDTFESEFNVTFMTEDKGIPSQVVFFLTL